MSNKLIKRIRDHAINHYNEDGWDLLVECWTDNDILDYIGNTDCFESAIIQLSDILSVIDGYRQEIQSA